MEPANDWGKNERVSSTNNNVHIVDFVARIQAPRFLHHPCLFHSIRNSIGVADWARSLKLCIYSYICICILLTYIYIYSIWFYTGDWIQYRFPLLFHIFFPLMHCFHYRWTNFVRVPDDFCVPTGKLCIQYCANVERYAQKLMVALSIRAQKSVGVRCSLFPLQIPFEYFGRSQSIRYCGRRVDNLNFLKQNFDTELIYSF